MLQRKIFTKEQDEFRATVRKFVEREAVPNSDRWEHEGSYDREFWKKAAAQGFVGFEVDPEYGGAGVRDFRFNAILSEEMMYAAAVGDGFSITNDILVPYLTDLTTVEQQKRWLPRLTDGSLIPAIAMSEPDAGSDLRGISTTATPSPAVGWTLNGSKTFITNGGIADLVIVVARTAERDGRLSLFAVEYGTPGFKRGRQLKKVGRKGQDTSELFFDNAEVPTENLIGELGEGFAHLTSNLAQERLSIAVMAVAASEKALEITVDYCKQRKAFGQPIGKFQANRFSLAEMSARIASCRAYLDQCIVALVDGELTAADAAAVKYLTTEVQFEVLDRCMQLHGGYGYMDEFVISRLWRDARVQRIYGGTSEIMLEIIGRDLGF